MYSSGEPSWAARDDTLTIAPPLPPYRVDIRRTACAAQRNGPVMLAAQMRASRASSNPSRRPCFSTVPALFTRAVSGPSSSSTVAKSRSTSAPRLTSARTATAVPPAARTVSATASAEASSLR